mmetsp:Transcript_19213/g.35695  ORF Transcript_19213/g.35695 Transcript_19213/m.35695 type:complete len:237 (-) Transcript_19213:663-1373(-)
MCTGVSTFGSQTMIIPELSQLTILELSWLMAMFRTASRCPWKTRSLHPFVLRFHIISKLSFAAVMTKESSWEKAAFIIALLCPRSPSIGSVKSAGTPLWCLCSSSSSSSSWCTTAAPFLPLLMAVLALQTLAVRSLEQLTMYLPVLDHWQPLIIASWASHSALRVPFVGSQMYISSELQQQMFLSSGLKQACIVHPLCPLSFLAGSPLTANGLQRDTLRSWPVVRIILPALFHIHE